MESVHYQREMDTPCIKVYAFDPESGLCSGCGRTLDEIAYWTNLGDENRQRIMT